MPARRRTGTADLPLHGGRAPDQRDECGDARCRPQELEDQLRLERVRGLLAIHRRAKLPRRSVDFERYAFSSRSTRGDSIPARTASSCAAKARPRNSATAVANAQSSTPIVPASGPYVFPNDSVASM